MAGYYGFSMSNNAVSAYECGEKPLSKWTKEAILSLCGEKSEELASLTVSELRKNLLYNSSWHHTSCHYNRTVFYAFDDDALEDMTPDRIAAIINDRQPRRAKEPIERITAEVKYTEWVGQYRNYRRPIERIETVSFLSSDKMLNLNHGRKRLSSVEIVRIICKEAV